MGWFVPALAVAAGAAGAYLSTKGQKGATPAWSTAPEYPEAEGARKMWWDKLQSWADDPYYGAISPDWSNIWQQAKQRVQEYYGGTPTAQGAYGRLKGSFASRNITGSPAMTRSLARLAAEEGAQMRDIAAQEAINKAEFGERARQDWLGSLGNLSQQKPTSQFYMEQPKPSSSAAWGAALQGAGGALSSYGMGQLGQQQALQQQQMLKNMLNPGLTVSPTSGISGTTFQRAPFAGKYTKY